MPKFVQVLCRCFVSGPWFWLEVKKSLHRSAAKVGGSAPWIVAIRGESPWLFQWWAWKDWGIHLKMRENSINHQRRSQHHHLYAGFLLRSPVFQKDFGPPMLVGWLKLKLLFCWLKPLHLNIVSHQELAPILCCSKKRHQDLLFKHRRINKQHQASSLIKIACHSFQSSFFF